MTVKGQGKYFDPTFTGSEGTWNRQGYSTDVYTNIAMDWLDKRDRGKPFLLSLQFKAPHHDYGHAERYNNLLADVGLEHPEDLRDYVDIPGGPLICRPDPAPRRITVKRHGRTRGILRHILILGLSTPYLYDPSRPLLLTRASLTRCLELFDGEGYYA